MSSLVYQIVLHILGSHMHQEIFIPNPFVLLLLLLTKKLGWVAVEPWFGNCNISIDHGRKDHIPYLIVVY